MTPGFAVPRTLLLEPVPSLFRKRASGSLNRQKTGGGHQVAEPVVDDGTGVGGREQVGVDAEVKAGSAWPDKPCRCRVDAALMLLFLSIGVLERGAVIGGDQGRGAVQNRVRAVIGMADGEGDSDSGRLHAQCELGRTGRRSGPVASGGGQGCNDLGTGRAPGAAAGRPALPRRHLTTRVDPGRS